MDNHIEITKIKIALCEIWDKVIEEEKHPTIITEFKKEIDEIKRGN